MKIVIFGLSITSSWGNGHATTYRALVRGLAQRGHEVVFLECDRPWYAANGDLSCPPYCATILYDSLQDLRQHADLLADADLAIIGSYVPDGALLAEWVLSVAGGPTAFYDIDTPVTMRLLQEGRCGYITPDLVPRYDLYLSFTGGKILRLLEDDFGARRACPLYCAVDADLYYPEPARLEWDLGYLGTFSADRQAGLQQMLVAVAEQTAARFVVAGSQYPDHIQWPRNVQRIEHLPPPEHCGFYNRQRFTLNLTRPEMINSGYSPSVRLFEAAACGTPIISDWWHGLEDFFTPCKEILIADCAADVIDYLSLSDERRHAIGDAARRRVLAEHTGERRAALLERYVNELTAVHPK